MVQERVALGAVDMACQTPSSAADKRFQLPYFPYMFKNFAQAEKNYRVGAPLRKIVETLYQEQGIKLLAAWPVYFGGISLNREPVNPGDPEAAKGIKLRVPPMKTFQMLADTTGYLGTPIPFSDALHRRTRPVWWTGSSAPVPKLLLLFPGCDQILYPCQHPF